MKRILIVDDQAETIDLVTCFLSGKYDVYAAKSIGRVFSLLRSNTFDLILLDVFMPAMSGIEFFQHIREAYLNKTPVIFMSSAADINIVSQAIKIGAASYIKKPFGSEKLIEKIEAVIGE